MTFRKANNYDAPGVLALYKSVLGSQYCVWDDNYPDESDVEADLANENLFVLCDKGEIIGAVSIEQIDDINHLDCWKIHDNTAEFARVAINPKRQGEGLSKILIEGIIEELKSRDIAAIHIAVAKVNLPAQKLYRGFDFNFCGEAFIFGHDYYLCEKIIQKKPL